MTLKQFALYWMIFWVAMCPVAFIVFFRIGRVWSRWYSARLLARHLIASLLRRGRS